MPLRSSTLPIALIVLMVVVGLVMTIVAPTVWRRQAEAACAKLGELKEVPFKPDEPATDPVYLALREHGRLAVPCLVDRVTDTTPMPDPRKAPPYPGFVVGDAAVVMLTRMGALQLPESLPEAVRLSWESDGMYAYFTWVREPAHRQELQQSLRERLNPGH